MLVQPLEGIGLDLAATEAAVTRLWLGLEGTWHGSFLRGLVPTVEIGMRHDGGDADTGFGSDLGAGFTWTDPGRGGRAAGHARGRRGHEDGGFRERGLSGTVREGWPAPRTRPPRVTRRARQRRSCGPRPRWPVSIATTTAAGRPARSCRWPPADSVPRAGAPGRTLSGSAPPDVIGDISHWPRAVREGWRGAVGVWRRDEHRRP